MRFSPDAQTVFAAVRSVGGRPLVVGGAVRDSLIGAASKDLDIEVHGIESLDPVIQILRQYGPVDEVGKSFGVVKFGSDIDISLPRRDSKVGDGHKAFKITVDPSMSLEEALSRRDFTINSMAFDPETGQIIDPFGGQQDLEDKILRHTSDAFAEDPLRVMRAVQFATRFGMTIAPDTARLCRSLIPLQRTLAKERVWGEWEKILTKGRDFDAFYRALKDTGIDQIIDYSFLNRHHFTNHWETALAQRGCGAEAILAYWQTSKTGSERQPFLESLGVPGKLARDSKKLADGMMMTVTMHSHDRVSARWIARRIEPFTIEQLTLMVEDQPQAFRLKMAARAADCLTGAPEPLVTGYDLMDLGIEPGPDYGRILKAALTAQDAGEFETKEEGMALIQEGKI